MPLVPEFHRCQSLVPVGFNIAHVLFVCRQLTPETGTGYWYQKTGQCVWPFSRGGRLPLLFARPAVTNPDVQCHHALATPTTRLYCLVTEAVALWQCERLAQNRIHIMYIFSVLAFLSFIVHVTLYCSAPMFLRYFVICAI